MRLPNSTLRRSLPLFLSLLLLLPAFAIDEAPAKPDRYKLTHTPKQPKSGERVLITLAAPPSAKADDLTLQYQIVDPGQYIALNDPAYEDRWKDTPFTKSETKPGTFQAELPAKLQTHRRLIRYRVRSAGDKALVAPAPDDPQKNYAYFVYDGIPAWKATINQKGTPKQRKVTEYSPEVMGSVQAYHLISKQESVENVTWNERKSYSSAKASEYLYTGTLVAAGKVYDHIRFRARGGTWRYAMGKNMWKIDFLKGHHLEVRDDWGAKYETKWGKLNLGACIQQGDYRMRGEHGLFEALAYRLFNLAGVEAPRTHWVQWRIIDGAEEDPADQYRGDFWGLYLATENVDEDFLKEHNLPEGSLYKMDFSGPEPKHTAEGGAGDGGDVMQFINGLRRNPDEDWWKANVDLPRYYSYRSVIECIHHYDIGAGKNYYFLHNPEAKRWQVIPWDVDLTWNDEMFGDGGEPFSRLGLLRREPFATDYLTRLAELRDLLYNPEQTGALIDESAAIISHADGTPSMVDADRAKWDYHPIMSSQYVQPGKSAPGLYYQSSPTHDFKGMTLSMKQYVESRSQWIDRTLLAEATPPPPPVIAPFKIADVTDGKLKLHLTRPTTAAKVKWRVAEFAAPKSAKTRGKYEIDPLWEAEGEGSIELPTKTLEPTHTYRIRARVQDEKGRWSHWSAPELYTPR